MLALVVDKNSVEMKKTEKCLRGLGHEVTSLARLPALPLKPEKGRPHVAFLCLDGQREEVLAFLEKNREGSQPLCVIVSTATPRLEDAVVCMKKGAHDFWVKPFDRQRLARAMEFLASMGGMEEEKAREQGNPERPILSRNPLMLKLKEMAKKVAGSDAAVFIQGESGTGKELFARYIHGNSGRRDKPFLALNCAALPENLLESELFGYEKGAFTGAIKGKGGKFELADGGTLLLDEVTEMSVPLQAKLLRVLQEKEVDRLGGRFPVPVNVRIIATTNGSMEELLEEGRFRKDLYYRLNVIPLKIPPLRERKEDIAPLCRHFMGKYSGSAESLHPETLKKLEAHWWPGNVRELENVIHRAVLLATGNTVTTENLFFDDMENRASPALGEALDLMSLDEMEKRLIFKALKTVNENRTRAAEILGISVRTLRNKLNEYRGQGTNVA